MVDVRHADVHRCSLEVDIRERHEYRKDIEEPGNSNSQFERRLSALRERLTPKY